MKVIRSMTIGVLIALSVSYGILTIRALVIADFIVTREVLKTELFIALALGIVIGGATRMLASERFAFPLLVSLHFVVIQVLIFSVGAFASWYDFNAISMLKMFGIVCAVYVLVWIIVSLLERREVEQLNALIRKK